MWWPTVADTVKIHQSMMRRTGDSPGACNEAKLDGALKRPQWLFHYEGITDIVELGVALAAAIAVSHAFSDGNKRTALSVLAIFLRRNGLAFAGQAGTTALGEFIEGVVVGYQQSPERGEQAKLNFASALRSCLHPRKSESSTD